MFGGKAKRENVALTQKVAELEATVNDLQSTIERIGGGEILHLEQIRKSLNADIATNEMQLTKLSNEIKEANHSLTQTRAEITNARDAVELQNAGLYDFQHPAEESVRLESELAAVRAEIKDLNRQKKTTQQITNFTFNNSASKGKSFVNKMSRMALRSYNAEVENAIVRMKAGNLDSAIKRVETASQVAKMGEMIDLRISPQYHFLRLKELRLASEHLAAKAAAKEAEREARAQLREEKKAQAEMEAERKRLLKERSHYENSINTLKSQGRLDELAALEAQLAEINRGIEDVDYRSANVRAGYVYVISNIGSFGPNVVKIGLTRRLDPMERVKELGDASVPFNFDVHVLHFSKDAVSVENELHKRFDSAKVNLINSRREFFYATPSEVKRALLDIDGSVLEYEEEAEAEQFKQSKLLRTPKLQEVTP